MRIAQWCVAVLAAGVLAGAGAEASQAVLVDIESHVNVVGWKNIDALELVVHGPALRTFLAKDIDPAVRGKLEALLAGGLRFDACLNTMARQKIELKELIEGAPPVPSGVVRVIELQEAGYAYIKP